MVLPVAGAEESPSTRTFWFFHLFFLVLLFRFVWSKKILLILLFSHRSIGYISMLSNRYDYIDHQVGMGGELAASLFLNSHQLGSPRGGNGNSFVKGARSQRTIRRRIFIVPCLLGLQEYWLDAVLHRISGDDRALLISALTGRHTFNWRQSVFFCFFSWLMKTTFTTLSLSHHKAP